MPVVEEGELITEELLAQAVQVVAEMLEHLNLEVRQQLTALMGLPTLVEAAVVHHKLFQIILLVAQAALQVDM